MTSQVSPRKISVIAAAVGALVLGPILATQLFENQDSSEIMVIQSPISGELSVYTEQGSNGKGLAKLPSIPVVISSASVVCWIKAKVPMNQSQHDSMMVAMAT